MSKLRQAYSKTESRQRSATTSLVITCEHGGNRVPASYQHLFRDSLALLESHRGFDPGAMVMAKALARRFSAPLLTATVSRLLVDLNRSSRHRHLHMEAIRKLPAATRLEILERYYHPYVDEAWRLMTQGISQAGRVTHISCHSFTNSLDGVVRNADIGLLYDPLRKGEVELGANWKSALRETAPDLKVRRNFPYQGRNDGLTSTLRKNFSADVYVGIELELNQKNLMAPAKHWHGLRQAVINSLDSVLAGYYP